MTSILWSCMKFFIGPCYEFRGTKNVGDWNHGNDSVITGKMIIVLWPPNIIVNTAIILFINSMSYLKADLNRIKSHALHWDLMHGQIFLHFPYQIFKNWNRLRIWYKQMSFYFPNLTFLRIPYICMTFEFYSLLGCFQTRRQLITESPSKHVMPNPAIIYTLFNF